MYSHARKGVRVELALPRCCHRGVGAPCRLHHLHSLLHLAYRALPHIGVCLLLERMQRLVAVRVEEALFSSV